MSGFDFHRFGDGPTPAEWQPLDAALRRWVRAHGGSPRLAELAGWCSYAETQGDSALLLDGSRPPQLAPGEAEALLAEPLCSDGTRTAPFVLEGERFYFWRNYRAECEIAEALAVRCQPGEAGIEVPPAEEWLDALFAGTDPQACAGQRAAVAAALQHRLLLLGGGPGTGKTSTVLRILLALQARQATPLRVRLAAPTGKAAQRLGQALREGRLMLAASVEEHWQAALARLPAEPAHTLHRLLEFDPRQNRCRRDARHRLDAELVVVDEASMVDLGLLHALLAVLPPSARLLLVGDPEQLHPVAAGATLADIGAALRARDLPHWQRLTHVFRAEAPLQPLLQAVQAGDGAALPAAAAQAGAAFVQYPVDAGAALAAALRRWGEGLARWQAGLPAAIDTPEAALAALRSFGQRQLLCALREGEFGALACHAQLEQRLRQDAGVEAGQRWYHGQALIVTRNDYGHGLYNGDIGLVLADAEGRLQAWFEAGEGGARCFAPNALPQHEGALALTIHKSQGSEYDEVAVLLPPDPQQTILSRQLLYTGASRARRRVELWALDAVLQACLARPASRASGLGPRLVQRLG